VSQGRSVTTLASPTVRLGSGCAESPEVPVDRVHVLLDRALYPARTRVYEHRNSASLREFDHVVGSAPEDAASEAAGPGSSDDEDTAVFAGPIDQPVGDRLSGSVVDLDRRRVRGARRPSPPCSRAALAAFRGDVDHVDLRVSLAHPVDEREQVHVVGSAAGPDVDHVRGVRIQHAAREQHAARGLVLDVFSDLGVLLGVAHQHEVRLLSRAVWTMSNPTSRQVCPSTAYDTSRSSAASSS